MFRCCQAAFAAFEKVDVLPSVNLAKKENTMTVLKANTARRNTRRNSQATQEREATEFDGLWINVGIMTGDEDNPTFNRLPRGIAVDDLKTRKVYDNMDPDFAADVTMMNSLISMIQEKGLELEEGESIPLQFTVQLYRRQEGSESDQTQTDEQQAALASLFG